MKNKNFLEFLKVTYFTQFGIMVFVFLVTLIPTYILSYFYSPTDFIGPLPHTINSWWILGIWAIIVIHVEIYIMWRNED